MQHDYYKILGVPKNADIETIKGAYFELAQKHHPERGGSHDEMVQIEEAWAILSDPETRQRYDEDLARPSGSKSVVSTQVAADTRLAREKAELYPQDWPAFESWWGRVRENYTNESYRAMRGDPGTSSPSVVPDSGYLMTPLIKAVMFVVLLITLTVWSVVGFIFWIPMLIRATTVFSALVVHAAFTRQDPHGARHVLESASGFYFRGFRSALDVIYSPPAMQQPIQLRLGLILIEICWTTFFWFVLLWLLSPATLTPLIERVSNDIEKVLRVPANNPKSKLSE